MLSSCGCCDGWLRTLRRLRTSGGSTGRESWGRAGHSYCSAASRDCSLPGWSRSTARSSVPPRARSGLWASIAEEAARIDQRIAGYLADLDATDGIETDDADAERTAAALV